MTNTHYRQTEYIVSAHNLSQMPPDLGCEVAFAGRSNVGKSSVINTITDIRRLAKVSKTPGRTQQINFFSVANNIRLVDLPGYGFAKVSKALKAHWSTTLQSYFETRQSLKGLILITDIRRSFTDIDKQMLAWCDAVELPVHILLNKSDKLSFGKAKQTLLQSQREMAGPGRQLQLFSALKRTGVQEVCAVLDQWLFPEKTK